jgi:hypothetical protein
MMEAASHGNIVLFDQMLSIDLDINTIAEDGYTALHCAARSRKTAMVEYLLGMGAAIDACNVKRKNRRPIHEAIQAEEPKGIDVLGKAGANTYNRPGDIIVSLVASTGNIAVVEAWFNAMPANVAEHDLSLLLLDSSVSAGQAGVLRWLLSQNPIIMSRTSKLNNLPQISAVLRDPVKPHQCLPPMIWESSLLSAEYIEAVSISLVRAAKRGHTEMVKLLLGCKDIDVNRRTSGGLNALFSAVVLWQSASG